MVKLPQKRNYLHLSFPFMGLIFSFGGRLNTSMLIFKCKKRLSKTLLRKNLHVLRRMTCGLKFADLCDDFKEIIGMIFPRTLV